MRKSDELVERVLAGLREEEIPPGMEQRILAAATETSSAPPRWNWWLDKSRALPLLGCGAIAVLVAVVFFAFPFHRLDAAFVGKQTTASLPHVDRGALHPDRENRAVLQAEASKVDRGSGTRPAGRASARIERPRGVTRSSGGDDAEALAALETNAPSHSAAKQPLTAQEKLLLQVVHRGDPEQLAMLNAQSAKHREIGVTYPNFFGHLPTDENE